MKKRFEVTVEIEVEYEGEPAAGEPWDFSPDTWMTSVFEHAFVKMGGPGNHPFKPKVTGFREIATLTAEQSRSLDAWKDGEIARVRRETAEAVAAARVTPPSRGLPPRRR